MPLPDIDTVLGWRGRTILDRRGEEIGTFEDIYLDSETDLPEWAAVKPGRFTRDRRLVPLAEAQETGDDDLQVPFDKAQVEESPSVGSEGELSQEDEARLYEHYGLEYSMRESGTGLPPSARTGREEPDETRSDDADADRSSDDAEAEEEMLLHEEGRPRERVRLKKHVVTEQVTKTVPVQREEVRVEREPVEDEERGGN